MQLITIAGQARVGKTTLAKIIAERAFDLGLTPVLLSFAGPLKRMAEEKGYSKEDNPKEYRQFCQQYGASKREEDPEYWVKLFEKELLEIREAERQDLAENKKYWERCIVVDDCRYPNEVELSMKYKATLIFLSFGKRDIVDPEASWRAHHSEDMAKLIDRGQNEYRSLFTCFIRNQGTEDELKAKVHHMIPIWCGIQPTNGNVIPDNVENMEDLTKSISELLDLLILGELEDDDEEDPTQSDT